MSKKATFYSVFFVALVTIFFLTVRPWIKRKDTISVVQPFEFINQDGKIVTDKDVEGKVYVAEYFFTTCRGVCPRLNANMKKVYDRFKEEKDFLILSHTCDPDIDNVTVLRNYSNSMGLLGTNWIFLTGRKDSLYNMARISYVIDDPKNNLTDIKDQFMHTQHWALVDRNGDVIRIYDGLKMSEVNKLIGDVKDLLKETKG